MKNDHVPEFYINASHVEQRHMDLRHGVRGGADLLHLHGRDPHGHNSLARTAASTISSFIQTA